METTKPKTAFQLLSGLLFGMIFGFLLQKAGVAKYHILLGVLLLEDFTVVKVMLTAILVGSIGVFACTRCLSSSYTLSQLVMQQTSSGGLSLASASGCLGTAQAPGPPRWGKETGMQSPALLA